MRACGSFSSCSFLVPLDSGLLIRFCSCNLPSCFRIMVITLAVILLRSDPPSTMHSRVPANHAVSPAVLPAVSPGGFGLAGDVGDDAGDVVVRGAVRGQGDQVGVGLGALHAGRSPGSRAGGSGPRLGRDRDRRASSTSTGMPSEQHG